MRGIFYRLYKYLNSIIIFFCTAIFFYFLIDFGEKVLDPGDGILHYQMAKYSWTMPRLFLNHWGKPLFTFLSSPFAQLGFKGMVVFNIFLFVVSSIFLLRITTLLKIKKGWMLILICFGAPIFFWSVLSGMTEILMCTILVLSLYCYLKENFILGTLILSFSLLARPESNIVIPFFMLYLLYKKQFIALPFILSGFIIFSFAGYFYYDNFFWIITERPYFSKGTYGTGSFFHFILGYKQILGLVATFLFVLGMISLFIKKQYEEKKVALFLLVLFPAISVLLVHSFLWWTSLYTSAGYFRVLSTVIPLFALISFLGLNTMFTWLEKRINKTYINILTLIISALIVFGGLFNLQIDNRLMIEQDVLIKAANWYKSQGENKKIYYLPPSFSYQARINPFTEEGTRDNMKYFGDKDKPSRNMKEGELLLWDGQYSRVEGQISLEDCLKDDNLLCVSSFYPKENITFYGHPYSVRIFKKVNKKVEVKNSFVNEFNKSIKSVLKTLRVENNSDEFLGLFHVDNKTSHRGVVLQYDFSCKIRLPAEYENKKLKLVYTWETLGEGVFYDSKNVEIKDGGGLLDFQFISNSSCFQNAEFRVYFWNINKYPISLSDIEFSVKAF